jgi:RNA polymerase sigma-70 factor (ECF subfamily)
MELEQEKELVERAKRDTQAFGELYEHYYTPIFGYVMRRTASIQIAQDITSEVFFKSLKNLRHFQWREVPFSAWLYRIAAHEIANHHNGNNRHFLPLSDELADSIIDPAPTAENELIEAETELARHKDFLVLQSKIKMLPVKYQEVIALRFFEDKSLKEISEILGKREGTVKSLLHRGLEKLRKYMV